MTSAPSPGPHGAPAPDAQRDPPTFYLGLASPLCWLAAERVNGSLPEPPVWQPVRGHRLEAGEPVLRGDPADLERRVADQGLPALRWPSPWPTDVELALRAAVFAQASGRVVAFSLAALRQAFAAARDLAQVETVLIAAAACELHPRAVLKGIESRSTIERLRTATEDAVARGVREVPAIVTDETVFEGTDAVEQAAAALARS